MKLTQEQWQLIKSLARKRVAKECWCPLCEITIGNGCMEHDDDCPLYVPNEWREGDRKSYE